MSMMESDLKNLIAELAPRYIELRRNIHAHPELAFEEQRTADLVAKYLAEAKIETHTGIAKTGVVAVLRNGEGPAIGLRADMDCLPLNEENTFAHRSQFEGRMHACGHDGHTAILLGAAELLARTKNFCGTIYCIFQPAEEHAGGGQRMVAEGLFERFPMQMVFGLHNWPGLAVGDFAVHVGPVMASTDRFEVRVQGKGGHAAMPHQTQDVIVASAALITACQTLVSRICDPLDSAVVSITRMHAGSADNILPEMALLGGTVRCLSAPLRKKLQLEFERICAGISLAHNVTCAVQYEAGYPPTINTKAAADLCRLAASQTATELGSLTHFDLPPSMGAEDFSYMSGKVPGCYAWIGNGGECGQHGMGGCVLHSPQYDFNDALITAGMRYWLRLCSLALPQQSAATQ